jgi:hypothetical protein
MSTYVANLEPFHVGFRKILVGLAGISLLVFLPVRVLVEGSLMGGLTTFFVVSVVFSFCVFFFKLLPENSGITSFVLILVSLVTMFFVVRVIAQPPIYNSPMNKMVREMDDRMFENALRYGQDYQKRKDKEFEIEMSQYN